MSVEEQLLCPLEISLNRFHLALPVCPIRLLVKRILNPGVVAHDMFVIRITHGRCIFTSGKFRNYFVPETMRHRPVSCFQVNQVEPVINLFSPNTFRQVAVVSFNSEFKIPQSVFRNISNTKQRFFDNFIRRIRRSSQLLQAVLLCKRHHMWNQLAQHIHPELDPRIIPVTPGQCTQRFGIPRLRF